MEKDLKARVKKIKEEDAIKLYGVPVKKKVKYSDAERKAYYMGVGAAVSGGRLAEKQMREKATRGLTATERKSFYNGYDDAMLHRVEFINKKKGG